MDADIALLSSWATVFQDPFNLMKLVANNYMKHGSDIMSEITKEKNDWSTGNYYSAGQDTAAIINMLVPFDSTLE